MTDEEYRKWSRESGLRNDHVIIPSGTLKWVYNHGMKKAAITHCVIRGGPFEFDAFYEFPMETDLPFSIQKKPGAWTVEFDKPILTDILLEITSAEPIETSVKA